MHSWILDKRSKFESPFSEVTLNSMSSVLSYNQFYFGPIFKQKAKEEKKREATQPSFMKQMIYFILFMVLNLGFVLILLLLFVINFVKYLKNHFSHIKTQSYNFCLFCQMFQIHRLTISTEVTMMSLDSVKLEDTNGEIKMLSKFQVSSIRWY